MSKAGGPPTSISPAVARRRALTLAAMLLAIGVAWAAVERLSPAARLTQAAEVAGSAAGGARAGADGDAGSSTGATEGGADDAGDPGNDSGDDSGNDSGNEMGDATGADAEGPSVEEMSEAEMRAQLEAIEAAAGTLPADSAERAAETPLPADLPVALPSDI